MRFSIVLLFSSVIAACASSSGITPYGKDTFLLNMDDVWGGNTSGGLQVKAAKEANEFCAKSGKVMRVRNTSGSGTAGWTSTSSALIFSCISENDPENTRPDLRREPNVVIEKR